MSFLAEMVKFQNTAKSGNVLKTRLVLNLTVKLLMMENTLKLE